MVDQFLTISDEMLADYFPGYEKIEDKRRIKAGLFNLLTEMTDGFNFRLEAGNQKYFKQGKPRTKTQKWDKCKDLVVNFLQQHKRKTYTPQQIAHGIEERYNRIGFAYSIERQLPQLLTHFFRTGAIEGYADGTYGFKKQQEKKA